MHVHYEYLPVSKKNSSSISPHLRELCSSTVPQCTGTGSAISAVLYRYIISVENSVPRHWDCNSSDDEMSYSIVDVALRTCMPRCIGVPGLKNWYQYRVPVPVFNTGTSIATPVLGMA